MIPVQRFAETGEAKRLVPGFADERLTNDRIIRIFE